MRVVGLGARCDLVPSEEDTSSPGGLSFRVSEFAVLDDGRRLTLHEERGWTQWVRRGAPPGEQLTEDPGPWSLMTRQSVIQDTLNVVLPDDDDPAEAHPYEWLAELLAARGVSATAAELRAVPYDVELSPRLEERLAAVEAEHD
jgi:hypothetical protein